MPAESPPDKKQVFLSLLQDGWVTVFLDGRRDGVQLPDHLRSQARVLLQYGLNMPVPIEDLQIGEDGIRATLSFNRVSQTTFVPWPAVYVLVQNDGPGLVFPQDVPAEIARQLMAGPDLGGAGAKKRGKKSTARAGNTASDARPAPESAPRQARPKLGLVPEDVPDSQPNPDIAPVGGTDAGGGPSDGKKPQRKRPVLKLVK